MDASRLPRDKPAPPRNEPLPTDDVATGSVTHWIVDLKAGDQRAVATAVGPLLRTTRQAGSKKSCALRGPMAVSDEEDVALSAFHSLYEGMRQGTVPQARRPRRPVAAPGAT